MLFLLATFASAAPTRCVAEWSADTRGCALRTSLVASGAGPSRKQAESAARAAMVEVVDRSAEAMMAEIPYLSAPSFSVCESAAAAEMEVSCNAEPSLAGRSFCFVQFPDPECWDGQVLTLEDLGWRAVDRGRAEMCAAVDAYQAELPYEGADQRRATCAARCQQEAVVTCPE